MKKEKWYFVNRYIGSKEGFIEYPKTSGVYAIFIYDWVTKKRQLLYIGTARNLYLRLKKHEVKKVLLALDYFVVIKCKIVKKTEERLDLENKLLNRLKPKINFAP